MSSWADLWDALTGIGTLALAIATFCIIYQGHRQRRDDDRQHRDQFKPICLLAPYAKVDPPSGRDKLISVRDVANAATFGQMAIYCSLKNIGPGPALNLRLRFRFLDKSGWTTDPWEMSPLGAGESYGSPENPIIIPVRFQDKFNVTDFQLIAGRAWEIWLDYQDVFGETFQTIHSKMMFDPDPSTFKWTEPEEGQQPKAIMRPIPWTTYVGERKKL